MFLGISDEMVFEDCHHDLYKKQKNVQLGISAYLSSALFPNEE